jgi:hypothetical protein
MTLHLIKLSVGTDSLEDLQDWQKQHLRHQKALGRKPELVHVTRQTPKREAELLEGGSIYWVVKGWIVARQRILDLRPMTRGGVPHCGIVYDRKVVPVQLRQQRAFQGWRYLAGKDAPADRDGDSGHDQLPESLKRELAELGLL